MKKNMMTNCPIKSPEEEEQWLLKAEGFIWDIVTQLYQLREQRELSQSELADCAETKQQAISRMENPGYDRHSLKMLRRVAKALGAFIDVVVVPEEKLNEYLEWRYQPVLMETAPGEEHARPIQWQIFVGEAMTDTFEASSTGFQKPSVTYFGAGSPVMFDTGEAAA